MTRAGEKTVKLARSANLWQRVVIVVVMMDVALDGTERVGSILGACFSRSARPDMEGRILLSSKSRECSRFKKCDWLEW